MWEVCWGYIRGGQVDLKDKERFRSSHVAVCRSTQKNLFF